MNSNVGNMYKAKVSKNGINKFSLVEVTDPGDWKNWCIVKDKHNNESKYTSEELIEFGIYEPMNTVFEITSDYYRSEDKYGNKDVLYGCLHIGPNIMSAPRSFRFWEECRYISNLGPHCISYEYNYKESLYDEEIINILENEILYGLQPGLQSMSCVGRIKKGIDEDPNYRDGHYRLVNNKDYTMTRCRNKYIIRESIDNGWYHDEKTCGRTIKEGVINWQLIKKAMIKRKVRDEFRRGQVLISEFPEIENILYEKYKYQDQFKLNSEF